MTTPPHAKAAAWWAKTRHEDRRGLLLARNRVTAALRAAFAAREFVEVEPASLQVSPGTEAHISGFATEFTTPAGLRQKLYLHSSPEFACKKLLAAGETRIFALSKVWRNGERGPLHHPEFTMLEWYRAGEAYDALMTDCQWLLGEAARAAGVRQLQWRGQVCDPFAEAERLSLAEAFSRYARIDLLALLGDRDGFAAAAQGAGVTIAPDDAWADIFSKVLVAHIESRLGIGRPTVLMDYPLSEAALARRSRRDPRVAERFELYACGVELANAFGELTDPQEQRARFVAEMDERERVYGERYPLDEDFLDALGEMPEASGIALGFDRLVMLLTGASRIDQVLWTPVPEP